MIDLVQIIEFSLCNLFQSLINLIYLWKLINRQISTQYIMIDWMKNSLIDEHIEARI